MCEIGFKTHQNEQHQCGPRYDVVDTQIFFRNPPTHLWVKKCHSLTLKHKITTSANYSDCIGTGYTSHNKEMCLQRSDPSDPFSLNRFFMAETGQQLWHFFPAEG